MGLVVAGERSRWLSFTNLPDQDEQVMDFTYKPSQATGLFGKVVTTMQQAGQEVHDLLMRHKDCVS